MTETTFSVQGCARFGDDHHELPFRAFARPAIESDGTVLTHWATCPTTGEPILAQYRPAT